MNNNKSMLDVAYDIYKNREKLAPAERAMKFAELFGEVAAILEMSEEERNEKIGAFYSGLSFDGRFVELTDNTWDLRSNHTYDKVHIDANDVYSNEEEDEEEESEEDLEEDDERLEGEENKEFDPNDVVASLNKDNLY